MSEAEKIALSKKSKKFLYTTLGITAIICAIVIYGVIYYANNTEIVEAKLNKLWADEVNPTSITVQFNQAGKLDVYTDTVTIEGNKLTPTINTRNLTSKYIENGSIVVDFEVFKDTFILTYLTDGGFRYNSYTITHTPSPMGGFENESVETAYDIKDYSISMTTTVGADDEKTDEITSNETITNLRSKGVAYVLDTGITKIKSDELSGEELPDYTIDSSSLNLDLLRNIRYTDVDFDTSDMILNMQGIGEVNIKDLSLVDGSGGFIYNGAQGIASIYNNVTDEFVMYILDPYNVNLLADIENMVRFHNYNNVYAPKDIWNEAHLSHNCLLVVTDAGMYYIKVNDALDENSLVAILDWLGINEADESIETIFKPIGDWENVNPPITADEYYGESLEDSNSTED